MRHGFRRHVQRRAVEPSEFDQDGLVRGDGDDALWLRLPVIRQSRSGWQQQRLLGYREASVMAARTLRLVLLAGALACSGAQRGGAGGEATVTARSIDEVLAAHSDSLMALPGVVGTAIGLCDGERCIKVFLADSGADTKKRIPARLEGYRVLAEVTGTIRPR